jgi:hypothetical protein
MQGDAAMSITQREIRYLTAEELVRLRRHVEARALQAKESGAVTAYNEMPGSMERHVFPLARKFPEPDRSLAGAALPELKRFDEAPFELQSLGCQENEQEPAPELGNEQADRAKI